MKFLFYVFTLFTALSTFCADVKWEIASWDRIMGSHRALISVEERAETVRVNIPWRRQDRDAEKRGMVLVDLTTGKRIRNFAITEFNRESIDLVFEPDTVPGKYAFYYLPLQLGKNVRTGQSKHEYLPLRSMADKLWLERIGLDANRYLEVGLLENLPQATLVAMQARTEHDNFYPMNVIATDDEVALLKENFPSEFLLFPEDRKYPICMTDYLPLKWIEDLPQGSFSADVEKGEYFAFQVGVFAAECDIEDLQVSWDDLKGDAGVIKADAMEIINRDIIDIYGKKTIKPINIPHEKVQALWFVAAIPADAGAGSYSTQLHFSHGDEKQQIKLILKVKEGEALAYNGTLDPWRMSRIKWLNIAAGIGEDIPAPFNAIAAEGSKVDATGKVVTFNKDGYPSSIQINGHEILASPVKLAIKSESGVAIPSDYTLDIKRENNRIVRVVSRGGNSALKVVNNVRIEYDGYMFFNSVITAEKELNLADIRLVVPYRKTVAKYMMGFNIGPGGLRPATVNWKWQDNQTNNKAWLGNVNAGLRIKLRGDKSLEDVWAEYRPEINGVPQNWSNNGKGGAKVAESNGQIELTAFTGARTLKKGETLELNFSLLPTPVKPRDAEHYLPPIAWNNRLSFMNSPAVNRELGADSAVLFHGTNQNPCINYPLYDRKALAEWCRTTREHGQKAYIYYKIGELTNFATEFMVLKSLKDEIFSQGNGVGDPYLHEHLDNKFFARWCAYPWGDNALSDASVMINGGTRWENFYINSLEMLIKECNVDGLYFDGMGYSRYFMQRIRSFANSCGKNLLLDFHCGNTITRRSNTYLDAMEHLPYFDTTWIGEGFNYNAGPDFYMVELSGIPFGVPNSMLQYGGNPWRGMLYGMSSRPLGNHTTNTSHLWKFFDEVRIEDSRLIGYWEEKECPASTDHANTLCSVYKFPDNRALIAVATWESADVRCRLKIDWEKLGIDPKSSAAYTPQIPCFQDEQQIDLSREITVPGGKGFLIMIEPQKSITKLIAPLDTWAQAQKLEVSGAVVSLTSPKAGNVHVTDESVMVNACLQSSAYAEVSLPANAVGISCRMKLTDPTVRKPHDWHDRYDGLNSPGVGVYNKKSGKYFRIHEASYGVWGIDDNIFDHMYMVDTNLRTHDKNGSFYVRIYWNDEYIVAESSLDEKEWKIIYAIKRSLLPDDFSQVRFGKMPKSYGWPRTVQEKAAGKLQRADYSDFKVYLPK